MQLEQVFFTCSNCTFTCTFTSNCTFRAGEYFLFNASPPPPHPLTNFKIQKYSQKEPKFNGVIQEMIYLK